MPLRHHGLTALLLVSMAGAAPTPASAAPLFGKKESAPVADNILIIVADIQRHLGDDLYRYAVPVDITGQNVFRAGLVRLANYENLHPGRAKDVVALNRAQCWERLQGFAEAEKFYTEAATSSDSGIRKLAEEGQRACKRIREILEREPDQSVPRLYDAQLREQIRDLDSLAAAWGKDPARASLARIAKERTQCRLAEFTTALRYISPYTTKDALKAHRAVVDGNPNSKLLPAHRMRLADLSYELSKEYVVAHDPDSGEFDVREFDGLVGPARAEYKIVEQADGFPEKMEARHKLAALEAFIEATKDRAR